jgi:zinc-finger of the FCS-type, C2-C2
MAVNQTRSWRRAIPEPITLCDRQSFSPEPVLSPTSPLERNWHSPRGWKKRETGGIGLAIVTSLEKSSDRHVTSPISIRGSFELSELGCSGRCTASVCGSRVAGSRDLRLKRDEFQVADFLNCCNLCRKKLHGKDIYMYR